MKTKITLLLLAALPLCTKAQVVIGQGEYYSIGETVQMQNASPDTFTAGGSGANQVWNFNTIASNGFSTSFTVSANNSTYFLNANIILTYSDGTAQYIKETGTDSYLMGINSNTNTDSEDYNNGIHINERPFTYMGNYIDSFTVITTAMHGRGHVTVNADAYGTLLLPSGSYNVLRVKRYIQETDTSTTNPADITSSSILTYMWFDENNNAPLLRIDSTVSINGHTTTVQYLANPLGIKNVSGANSHFTAALSNGQLVLKGNFEQNRNYYISLYDMTGQKIFTTDGTPIGSNMQFDMHQQLAAGMYFVKMINTEMPSNVAVIKVVKQ